MLDISIFEQLGINKKQAKVYLAALELGPSTIAKLAQKSGIKRTTLNEFIQEIVAKGLLVTSVSGKRRLYSAISPAELEILIDKQKEIISQIKPELNLLASKTPQKPKVRYYEGQAGVRRIYEEMLHVKDKDVYYFGAIKETEKVIGEEYLKNWVKRRIKAGVISHAVRVKSKEAKEESFMAGVEYLRELRFFPLEIKGNISQILVYDNNVAIVSTIAESYSLIIESAELAATIKYFWQVIWGVSKTK
ncbi:MAG: hypothetical protein NT116_05655 [Candidatus Parcubacteria bacterium]|nr:hypothetical protein [Candidatus Parcubacteria bacterium]